MAQGTIKPGFMAPAFVESFEYMDDLRLHASIEMRYHSVRLLNSEKKYGGQESPRF